MLRTCVMILLNLLELMQDKSFNLKSYMILSFFHLVLFIYTSRFLTLNVTFFCWLWHFSVYSIIYFLMFYLFLFYLFLVMTQKINLNMKCFVFISFYSETLEYWIACNWILIYIQTILFLFVVITMFLPLCLSVSSRCLLIQITFREFQSEIFI